MASTSQAVLKTSLDDAQDTSSPGLPSSSLSSTPPIPPRSDDPSAICLIARDCLQRFQIIKDILENSASRKDGDEIDQNLAFITLPDARAKFKAWGSGIAAFQDGQNPISLDFRLREAPLAKARALRILEELQEYLYEATLIVSGQRTNEQWGMSDSSEDSELEERSTDQQKSGMIEKQQNISELQVLFSAINVSNSSLMKLSMVIRSSPVRDDYSKAASRFKDWNPYPDIGHVREKHGSARCSTDMLLIRLGKAITRRRQFLKYRVEHFEKLSGAWDDCQRADKDNDKPEKTVASTKATTFMGNDNIYLREGSDTAGSFGSQTSYEATVLGDENTSQRLTVPPPPSLAFPDLPFEFGEPFNCPYCYTEQNVKNKAAWKKHVFRDLKPYICTFKECDMMMFRSRNEWFAHELQNHRRQWACQYCRHGAFTDSDAFTKHITSSHSGKLANSQMQAILLQSEETISQISAFTCPLCDEWEASIKARQRKQVHDVSNEFKEREFIEPRSNRNQFRRHLGRHMEQLALFALPMSENNELESNSTDGDEKYASNQSSDLTRHLVQPIASAPDSVSSGSLQSSFDGSDVVVPTGDTSRRHIIPESTTLNPKQRQDSAADVELNERISSTSEPATTTHQIARDDSDIKIDKDLHPIQADNMGRIWPGMHRQQAALAKAARAEADLERERKEELEKEYVSLLEKDLRNAGHSEQAIAAMKKKETSSKASRPTFTRMSRRHLSIETLNVYKIDFQFDVDPNYLLIERWVPEYEQDFLWNHTRKIREQRKLASVDTKGKGSQDTEMHMSFTKTKELKKKSSPSLSPLLNFSAGGKR